MGGKLLGGIKSMYVDSLACVRVKGGVSEWFRIDMRSDRVLSCPHGFSMKEVKMGMGRRGVRFMEEGRKWRLPGLL